MRIGFVRFTEIASVVVTGAIVLILIGPVRGIVLDRDLRRFQTEAAMIQGDVRGFFALQRQIAMQIPSRTRIREELARLVQGEITPEEYRSFAGPKLADAVRASDEILSVFRYDAEGNLVATVNDHGVTPPGIDNLIDGDIAGDVQMLLPSEPRTDHERAIGGGVYYVVAPINHRGVGTIGYDVVVLSLAGVHRRLADAVDRVPDTRLVLIFDQNGEYPRSEEVLVVEHGGIDRDREGRPGESRILHELDLGWGWRIRVERAKASLFGETNRDLIVLGASVLLFGVVLYAFSRWVAVQLSKQTAELSSIVTEQTARLRHLVQERDVLLREVHHRIKNDMSMVRSLMSLQRQEAVTQAVKDALAEAESRVGLMAEIYDLLYRSDDFGAVRIQPVLENLLRDVVASHSTTGRGRDVELDLSIVDVVLPRRGAAPIGMIANELLINAMKYGTTSDGGAQNISITLDITRGQEDRLELVVTDTGPGIPLAVREGSYGFGLEMIHALIAEYEGTVSFPEVPTGGRVIVRFTIPSTDGEEARDRVV